jgi:hypothetical protein
VTVTAYPLRRALTANSAATSFTAKIPVAVEPSGAGVFDLFDRDLGFAIDTYIPRGIQVIPFGTDANDETFDMRVWGWSKVHAADLWIPQMLGDLTVTLGNIAATAIGADHFLSDTIVVNEGSAETTSTDLVSTADDTPASVILYLRGCQLIEFDFDLTGGAAANCYFRPVDEC